MKFICFLALIALISVQTGISQTIRSAYVGTVGFSIGAYDNSAFSDRLQSFRPVSLTGEPMVYRTEPFSNVGNGFTLNLSKLFSGGFVFGASMEFMSFPVVHSITGPGAPQDEYRLSTDGLGIDLGYSIVNSRTGFLYPSIHAGYYRYLLEYQNNQQNAIPFFEGSAVAAKSTATYSGSAPLIGLGIGFSNMFGSSSFGLAVSGRLRATRFLSIPEWEQNDAVVKNGGHTPCHCGVTLDISVGAMIKD